jgi:hypothetical protein
MKKLFFVLFILCLSAGYSSGQVFNKRSSGNADKQLFSKSSSRKKDEKIKEPRSVVKAKKEQEAKKKKIDKEKKKYIKWSQKRAQDIQTPEVQARMKKDRKDSTIRNKEKRKKIRSGAGKARKKYKK